MILYIIAKCLEVLKNYYHTGYLLGNSRSLMGKMFSTVGKQDWSLMANTKMNMVTHIHRLRHLLQ